MPFNHPSHAGVLASQSERASRFLKAVANGSRLQILCALAAGEKNVSELEDMLGLRQPTLSQQLAKLREEKMVRPRREGKLVYYRLSGHEVREILPVLHRLFCGGEQARFEEAGRQEAV